MNATDQIEALSRAVNASDAGRRVGWARAYSAEASKEDLSRQINQFRAERDILYRHASYIHGFANALAVNTGIQRQLHDAMNGHAASINAVLDSEVMRAGREAAQVILASEPSYEEKRAAAAEWAAERKAIRKPAQNARNRDWKAAREAERKHLMEQYGIPNDAALHNYLAQYGH